MNWKAVAGAATVAGVMFGIGGGWLLRHDVAVVTQENNRREIEQLKSQYNDMKLTMDRMNAYNLSFYMWSVRVSERMQWPAPPEPRFYLPSRLDGRREPPDGFIAGELPDVPPTVP